MLPSATRKRGAREQLALERLRELAPSCAFEPRALAARLGISLRHLQRHFVTQLRCSPRTWLREERLRHARELLPTSSQVKAVAYALGFKQVSQFARDFREHFGVVPSSLLLDKVQR